MRLARLGPVGSETPCVISADGTVLDLRPVTADIDSAFFASDGVARARVALSEGRLTPLGDADSLRVGAPVARPGAIVCVGQNYAAHARESGAEPPTEPVIFLKHPNTLVGPADDVLVPRGSERTDWEVELAVVIGSPASYLSSLDEARACIAGYTVSNDVSERAFQLDISGGQWSKGKCCATFNPLGPSLVTADEIDPASLRLQSWVNGEPRQDSKTSDMIFSAAEIVLALSQVMTLEPGDIINTGTPEGVALSGRFPYLSAGDVVTCEVEGLGRMTQRIGAA